MDEILGISLAQINPKSGDLEGNSRLLLEGIERARAQQADLVVFPELCLTGYCLDEKLLINPSFLEESKRFLMETIRPAVRGLAAVVGFVDSDPDRRGPDGAWIRYNAAAVIQEGRLLQVARKRLLPSYRYFEDKRYFQPGEESRPVVIRNQAGREIPIGVLICEDIWDEEYPRRPARIMRQQGARCLVVVNASPFVASAPGRRDGKRFQRRRLLQRQVDDLGVPIVYVNTVGAGDNGKNLIVFDGASLALDARGRLVACLESFRSQQLGLRLCNGLGDALPEPEFDREGEIFAALALGVRDYCDKIGAFRSVLEPISGGVDSALGAAVAWEAVGPERLSLYNLPSRYNSSRTRGLAQELAANLGLKCEVVPIQDMVDCVADGFQSSLHPMENPVTWENLQARLRGVLMMAEANERQALLLSNGNSTEIALGYATLYGDMAGGLAPIGDLIKPDVYRLSRYVNRLRGREVIPRGIIEAVPSAELTEGQSDPFEYDLAGPLVADCVERGLSPLQLLERFRQRRLDPAWYPPDVYGRLSDEEFLQTARRLYGLMSRAVYKRLQGPPIIAVSRRAFGFDLRETLINGWKERSQAAALEP